MLHRGSSCFLVFVAVGIVAASVPASLVAAQSGPLSILTGGGGNFAAMGYGASGYELAGSGRYVQSLPDQQQVRFLDPSTGHESVFSIDFDRATTTINATCVLVDPSTSALLTDYWAAPSQLIVRVQVRGCARVSFYAFDYNGEGRRISTVMRGDRVVANLTAQPPLALGLYVAFVQGSSGGGAGGLATTDYTFTAAPGSNGGLAFAGVFFDPAAPAECAALASTQERRTFPTRSSNDGGGGGLPLWLILVLVAVLVLLCALLVYFVLLYLRERREEQRREELEGKASR